MVENNTEQKRFSFGLQFLFYTIALFSTGLAILPGTIIISSLVVFTWSLYALSNRPGFHRGLISLGIIQLTLVTLFFAWFVPFWHTVSSYQKHNDSKNNLRLIGLAIQNYHSVYGQLPVIKKQKTTTSWRYNILQFLEQASTYSSYDVNQAWDSESNYPLAKLLPTEYSSGLLRLSKTPYKFVVGSGSAGETGTLTLGQSSFLNNSPILIIEDLKNPVYWSEPEDLTVEQAINLLQDESLDFPRHFHDSLFYKTYPGTSVLFSNGAVVTIGFGVDKKTIEALISGEKKNLQDIDVFSLGKSITVYKYNAMFATAVYVAFILLPFLHFSRSDETTKSQNEPHAHGEEIRAPKVDQK